MSMVHGGHDGHCNRCPSSKTLISFSTSSLSSNLEITFGSLPSENISKSNTPYAQISVFGENFPYKIASGACLEIKFLLHFKTQFFKINYLTILRANLSLFVSNSIFHLVKTEQDQSLKFSQLLSLILKYF